MRDRCPTHKIVLDADGECSRCEAAIQRAELAANDADPSGWQPAQDRYERWLDEVGGSR